MLKENKGRKVTAVVVLMLFILCIAGATYSYFTDHHAVMNEFTVGQVKTELTETKWHSDPSGKAAAKELRPNMTIVKDPVVENTGTSDCYTFIAFRVPYSNFAALGQFGPEKVNNQNVPGLCQGFDEVNASGSVNIAYKDLFRHDVNHEDFVLVENRADMAGKYHEYVYAYANGTGNTETLDPASAEMKVMHKGDKTAPLFRNEKIRVINLVEDAWAVQHTNPLKLELTENKFFNIPVRTYSIQTTDIITTDGVNDTGATNAADVWKVVKAQVNTKYQGMKEENWGNVTGSNDGKGNDASNHGAANPAPVF